jgi:fatty-acyl-CoA synthase
LRQGGFNSLAAALEYGAEGATGMNFYSRRGELAAVLPYAVLRDDARGLARRFAALGMARGSHVALVADTEPDFVRLFFACQYAGLVPVPLAAAIHLGGHQQLVRQLRTMLRVSRAAAALSSAEFLPFLKEAVADQELVFVGTADDLSCLPAAEHDPDPLAAGELAYIQYTSGSTSAPRGAMISQRALMANLEAIGCFGLQVRDNDRCVSWLPFYHDMGLVGFLLAPLATQRSVDYLKTRDFALRPRCWPELVSRNRGTISFSPTFGYALCTRRMRETEISGCDLSSWRIAGVGAEPIRTDVLRHFAERFAPAGFSGRAFVAAYGLAEATLAVSFSTLNQGLDSESISTARLVTEQVAVPVPHRETVIGECREFVRCGRPLPGLEVAIRDEEGNPLPERCCGILHVRGPSVMEGYFDDFAATAAALPGDGWLNTGDLAYVADDQLVITGREKDLIIVNGRNIWPQDMEELAESLPDIRMRDVAAFSIDIAGQREMVVLVVQSRLTGEDERLQLANRLRGLMRESFGIDCHVDLVPPHTLPQTSSGKISRATARRDFLRRNPGIDAGIMGDDPRRPLLSVAQMPPSGVPEAPVAVTGATGFIGREVVRQLLAEGCPVRALCRVPDAGRQLQLPGITWIVGDLDDPTALQQLVADCQMVVHCAGVTRGLSLADFCHVNEHGVRQLADIIYKQPAGDRPRLLHISSLAAREPHLSPYAASKRRGEQVLEVEFADLSWTIFRPPAVYGPGDREIRPLLAWLRRGVLFIPGNPAARLSLLHVSDLAAAVCTWRRCGRDTGRTFTLDDGHPGGYAWEDIQLCGSRLYNRRVFRIPIARSVLHVAAGINAVRRRMTGYRPMLTAGKIRELTHADWVCDCHELRAACGWQPQLDLAAGLRQTLDEHQTQSN